MNKLLLGLLRAGKSGDSGSGLVISFAAVFTIALALIMALLFIPVILLSVAGAAVGGQTGEVCEKQIFAPPAAEISYPTCAPFDVTSVAGYRPDLEGLTGNPWHNGIDIAHRGGSCNIPIFAVQAGKVTGSSTLFLTITLPDGTKTEYLHSELDKRRVKVGDKVAKGQIIALIGNVQPSTACHLDFRVDVSKSTNEEVKQLKRIGRSRYVDPAHYFKHYGLDICPNDWCSGH